MKLIHYNGYFYDQETHQRVILKPKFLLSLDNDDVKFVRKPDYPKLNLQEKIEQMNKDKKQKYKDYKHILPQGAELYFKIPYLDGELQWEMYEKQPEKKDREKVNTFRIIKCELLEDLFAKYKKNTKGDGADFYDCTCIADEVVYRDIPYFEQIKSNSLAHLFREVAYLYSPEGGVYNANVSDAFFTNIDACFENDKNSNFRLGQIVKNAFFR